jgi:hypothetical protein
VYAQPALNVLGHIFGRPPRQLPRYGDVAGTTAPWRKGYGIPAHRDAARVVVVVPVLLRHSITTP